MTETSVPGGEVDADLKAIRNLMAEANKARGKGQPENGVAGVRPQELGTDAETLWSIPPPAEPHIHEAQGIGATSLASKAVLHLARRIRSYRPCLWRILTTSLILLVLLQPGLVFGAVFLMVAGLGLSYLVMGGDRFWRRSNVLLQLWASSSPQAARRARLRAFVLSRKWDRLLRILPLEVADALRLPDPKRAVAADARHDAAMSERLTRLSADS